MSGKVLFYLIINIYFINFGFFLKPQDKVHLNSFPVDNVNNSETFVNYNNKSTTIDKDNKSGDKELNLINDNVTNIHPKMKVN
uniref:Uncharacterized protein n=1 Tax=Strongyloides stercoralis TaxID=6248 RepID=A0A0K0EF96_STRER